MKRTLTLFTVLMLLGHAGINQILLPSLTFKKQLFGYEQNGPAGLSGCLTGTGYTMPDVFTKITGQDPANPGTIIYGSCVANNTTTFAGDSISDFRMTFTESVMTLYEEISNNKSKSLFTGGMGYIEKFNGTGYDTIMVVENFTVFMKLKCPPTIPGLPDFDGHVIGDIVPNKGNQAFLAEFTKNGKSSQIKAKFISFEPPQSPAALGDSVMPFQTVLELTPMPGKGNEAYIAGQQVPGKDSTMTFPGNTGTKMKLSNYTPFGDSTVIPAVTVCHYPWRDTIPPAGADNAFANVFSNLWWLVGSNLNNVSGEMCFNYGKLEKKLKRKLKKSQLANLSGSWQDSSGSKFNKIKKLISIDTVSKEVCFEIDHFSNWTIALEKPAAARVVPTNDGANGTFVTQVDTAFEFELKFPGSGTTDTIKFERYDMDPGGEYDTLKVAALSDRFWELTSNNNTEGSVGLDVGTTGGKTVLYRPDATSSWDTLPATRVRRGMKESMMVKPNNKKGQYIVAETQLGEPQPQLYTANIGVDTVCKGKESTFTPTVTGGVAPYTYTYNFGDSTLEVEDFTGAPQKHPYTDPGTYSTTITVTDANLVDIEYVVSAKVNSLPTPKITAVNSVELGNNGKVSVSFSSVGSVDAVGYLWDFGDRTISVEENPIHEYTSEGTRNVYLEVTSQNSCKMKNTTPHIVAVEPNSIEEVISSKFGLEIFPNPNSDAVFNVKFNITGSKDVNLSVYDAIGKQVISEVKREISGTYTTKIDLTGYPKGMYLFKISDGKNMSIMRMLYQ